MAFFSNSPTCLVESPWVLLKTLILDSLPLTIPIQQAWSGTQRFINLVSARSNSSHRQIWEAQIQGERGWRRQEKDGRFWEDAFKMRWTWVGAGCRTRNKAKVKSTIGTKYRAGHRERVFFWWRKYWGTPHQQGQSTYKSYVGFAKATFQSPGHSHLYGFLLHHRHHTHPCCWALLGAWGSGKAWDARPRG